MCYNLFEMPELPEVETIRLGLQKYLLGHTIERVEIRLPKMVSGNTDQIIGTKVTDIRRFGKALVIDLNNNFSIVVHVKMTGQLVYKGSKVPKGTRISEKVGKRLPHNHTHVIFYFDNNAVVYYNDVRQFGWIKILKTDNVSQLQFFKNLGPEPLNSLTKKQFNNIIARSNAPIKSLLMDQKKISGIGNIYANDALYYARIDPRRKVNTLSQKEIELLFYAIEEVLQKGLAAGGSSEWNYVNALGETGNYQKIFLVYGRDGEKCQRCGETIQKIKFVGRGTYFCSECQK
jgi:formamidopyrimidine-DNA glycosylase